MGKGKSQAAVSLRAAVPCLVLLIGTAATAREKTDTLTLKNGDPITGEIVKLEYGKLASKTSDLGTLSIAWNTVAALNSSYMFDGERPIPAFLAEMPRASDRRVTRAAPRIASPGAAQRVSPRRRQY